ncbi:hypothetical protein PoB_007027000 [Plakobranchus ocellatus]|uniref:Uncharacterized protein n=1 Tax=Plakobranchus ocellatus TaxID=259542 RepID=A0AAV4DI05_9GAST|nr:hypothetical protein PoB_007027000 [Plakobranchus ocellatus]
MLRSAFHCFKSPVKPKETDSSALVQALRKEKIEELAFMYITDPKVGDLKFSCPRQILWDKKFEGKRSRGRQREKIMDGLATWLGTGKVLDTVAAVKDRDL